MTFVLHKDEMLLIPQEFEWLFHEPKLRLQGIKPNAKLTDYQLNKLILFMDLVQCTGADVAWAHEKYVTENYSKFRGTYYHIPDDQEEILPQPSSHTA